MGVSIDDVVVMLYEALLEPSLLQPSLDALKPLINATACVQSMGSAPGLSVSSNLDPTASERYRAHFASVDPWMAEVSVVEPPHAIRHSALVSPAELERSEFYNDFLHPQALYWGASALIARGADGLAYMSAMRAKEAGDFTSAEMTLLTRLIPHLRTSVALRHQLNLQSEKAWLLKSALEAVPAPVMLVDGHRRVLMMTPQAESALTGRGSVLKFESGRFAARDPAADRKLEHLLARATLAPRPTDCAAGVMYIEGRSESPGLQLAIAPFRQPAAFAGSTLQVALVLLSTGGSSGNALERVLAALFGFTAAEARCALQLARGDTVAEIVTRTGVRVTTVRAHVRSLLAKTGTKRQGALIALLHRRLAALGLLID